MSRLAELARRLRTGGTPDPYAGMLRRDGLAPAAIIAIVLVSLAAGAWLGTQAGAPPAARQDLFLTPAPTRDTDELEDLLSRLGAERLDAREALAAATRPRGQAAAARSLQRRYRLAAARVEPGRRTIAAALRDCAAAYRRLAAAASARDRRGYARAARQIDAAERALERVVAGRL